LASNPDFILYVKNFCEFEGKQILQPKEYKIAKEISEILEKINSDNSVISAYNLVNDLNTKFQFEYEQQDSYELYHRFIELFDNHANLQEGNNYPSGLNNSINPFMIELETTYKCDRCLNSFKKNDYLFDISLNPGLIAFSVNTMIDNYFNPEIIADYTCSKCTVIDIIEQIKSFSFQKYNSRFLILKNFLMDLSKKNIEDDLQKINEKIEKFASEKDIFDVLGKLRLEPIKTNLIKKSEINKYPKIMTVHVNKVFYDEYVYTNKMSIVFPEILNFGNKKSGEGILTYELTSFVEHFGHHNFGHYIAYRKFLDKWIFINDSRATLINKSKAFQVPNPYILFYRMVNEN